MTTPKSPVTDLLRKLKADTDARLKSDQALLATLEDLIARVGEVESLETRAAAATFQFDDVTRRYRETEAALQEARETYAKLSVEVAVPANKLHELRTMLKSL
jgi:hypothetical protein